MKQLSQGEQTLRDRVQNELYAWEVSHGRTAFHKNGGVSRVARVLYYITGIFSLFVLVLHELILWVMESAPWYRKLPDEWVFFERSRWLVHALLVLAVFSLIFALLKKHTVVYGLQAVFGVGCIVQIVLILVGYPTNQALLVCLYVVSLISSLSCGLILLARYINNRRINKAVEEEYTKIYNSYDRDDGELLDSDTWEAWLLDHENALKKEQ